MAMVAVNTQSEPPSIYPEPIVMPDWLYCEFHNWIGQEEEDRVREMVKEIQSEDRFNPEMVGQDEALENTKKYFQENDFHPRDTRVGPQHFLTEGFPCGVRPCDLIKRLRAELHCESSMS
jgi:hypothetical protein